MPESIPAPLSFNPHDPRVRENIKFIPARARKLAHDRPLTTRLKPVPRVRRNRKLLPPPQHDLPPPRVTPLLPPRRPARRLPHRLPLHIQLHPPPPATKRLHLPRLPPHRRMPMLRTSLPRQQNQLLRAIPLIVLIHHNAQ